ncbi:hypothetical protein OSB04_013672 [Centaurea solstitialis]|uniref:Uncharacterized protein n=1 Tax=Centaurea solstitialis TaxID=347529 RepID=A0AA38TYG3_9ASTR|nr:hypothetical protein OSB04_013672 [Centaurea solstitialis]
MTATTYNVTNATPASCTNVVTFGNPIVPHNTMSPQSNVDIGSTLSSSKYSRLHQSHFMVLQKPTMAHSSVESEYMSLAHTSAETTWLSYLLWKLSARVSFPIMLHFDNLSTVYMALNLVVHARKKHIELDYHFVREKVARGSHKVCFFYVRSRLTH